MQKQQIFRNEIPSLLRFSRSRYIYQGICIDYICQDFVEGLIIDHMNWSLDKFEKYFRLRIQWVINYLLSYASVLTLIFAIFL